MSTELMMSCADIAEATRLSPRQINNYRAAAERRLGVKFGRKEGKTTYFDAAEVKAILQSREAGNQEVPRTSRNFRETVDFSDANNQAEDSTLNGMEAIVAATDQQAITMGQAVGQRFNNILWVTAIQTMNSGMVQMQAQLQRCIMPLLCPSERLPNSQASTPTLLSWRVGNEPPGAKTVTRDRRQPDRNL